MPPWLAPVIMMSALPSAATSLPMTSPSDSVSARQASYSPRREPAGAEGRPAPGSTRLAPGGELFVQVEAADVEAELGAEQLEEAQDVVGGLGERVGDDADAAVLAARDSVAVPASSRSATVNVAGARFRGQPVAPAAARRAARST